MEQLDKLVGVICNVLSTPFKGSSKTSSHFMLQKLELMNHFRSKGL